MKNNLQMADKVPGVLYLSGDVEASTIEAAAEGEPKLRKFSGTAYTGVKIRQWWSSYPIVVDLSGVKVTQKARPILRDHDPGKIVGHASIEVTPRLIRVVDGVVSGANEHAREIVESSDNGFPWRMSIGASLDKVVFVDDGETASVNGRTVSGPCYIVRQCVLNEVSFVALGADDGTSAAVAASAAPTHVGVISMKFQEWLQAHGFEDGTPLTEKALATLKAQYEHEQNPPQDSAHKPNGSGNVTATGLEVLAEATDEVKKKNARSQAIALLAKQAIQERPGQVNEIEAMARLAIEANQEPKDFELELLRATRSQTGGMGIVRRTDRQLNNRVVEAAICMAGRLPDVEKRFDDQTLQAAHDQFRSGIGLKQIFLLCARENGFRGDSFDVTLEVQRAAFGLLGNGQIQATGFSTLSLPGILSNAANKFLLEGWGSGDMAWKSIAAIKPVRDFKQTTSYRLSGTMKYEKVGPGGELKHGEVSESTYTNKADTYGRMFAITRTDLINDDLGALTQVPYELGVGALDSFNEIFWTAFLNNSSFFHTSNSNVSTGGGSALGLTGLAAAEAVFLNQTKPNGQPLSVMPAVLLVPSALKATALTLMDSEKIIDGTSTGAQGSTNIFRGRFKVESSPYMSNSAFTGYSALAWYLLADPRRLAVIEACFLNGRDAPVIETADASFNVLGVEMRGYHDFGVEKQEPRGGVRSAGQ